MLNVDNVIVKKFLKEHKGDFIIIFDENDSELPIAKGILHSYNNEVIRLRNDCEEYDIIIDMKKVAAITF